jgi:hypothetical protein
MVDDATPPRRPSAFKQGSMIPGRPHPKPAIWEHAFALAFVAKLRELDFDPSRSIMYSDEHRAASKYARAVADLALSGVKETERDGVFLEPR